MSLADKGFKETTLFQPDPHIFRRVKVLSISTLSNYACIPMKLNAFQPRRNFQTETNKLMANNTFITYLLDFLTASKGTL